MTALYLLANYVSYLTDFCYIIGQVEIHLQMAVVSFRIRRVYPRPSIPENIAGDALPFPHNSLFLSVSAPSNRIECI